MNKLFLSVLIFVACILSIHAEIIVPEGVELKETNLWTPFVDTLRIRETPDLNGKVVATIKLGEQVEYIETSKNTSTVDFNGEKITDTWIKVKMNDEKIGWGWKGFMVGLKKYWDPKTNIRFVLPLVDEKKIQINITRTLEESGRSGVREYANKSFELPANENNYVSFLKTSGDPSLAVFVFRTKEIKINNYYFSIHITLWDTCHFLKMYKHYTFGSIGKKEFEKKILPITNNISQFDKVVKWYKLEEKDGIKVFKYRGDITELDKLWTYLYSKNYIPEDVDYPFYWNLKGKSENDCINNLFNDIKKGSGAYILTQWYNATEILFDSLKQG